MNWARLLMCVVCGLMTVNMVAERVSQEEAALVANGFMNSQNASSTVKKAPAKRMVHKAAASQEAQYYIYENADGEGWVMVAANDAVSPILAYSETGHFRTDRMPKNIRKWLSKYDHFIQKIESDGIEASAEAKSEWTAVRKGIRKSKGDAVVGPLIKTQWDQDAPYNNLCPGSGTWGSGSTKAATGCVATAMAQVMNYWQWPKQGTGSHTYQPLDPNSDSGATSKRYGKQTANFGETTYDWDNMLNKYTSSATSAQKTAVATLMYHCGVATEMMYGSYDDGGSGTYTVNYGDWDDHECAQSAFPAFFGYKKTGLTGYMRDGYTYEGVKYYDKWSDADWIAMIKAELDKKHPIMYGGAGDEGGHSFICDGYDDAGYFHFNWGWSGDCDGYFKLSNLNPGGDGIGGGSYDFSEDQDVIIGIVPDKKDLPKVNVTWSVEGVENVVTYTQEDPLVLPTEPAGCSAEQVFVGWTANSTLDGSKPADLFRAAGYKSVIDPITYYAVFAKITGTGGAIETKTYTFSNKDWTDDGDMWSSTKDGYAFDKTKEAVQITESYSGAGAQTKSELKDVSKIIVTYCTNSKKGDGSITMSVGGVSVSKNVTKDGGASMRTVEFEFDNVDGVVSMDVTCTTNSIYIQSVKITSGGGVTYGEYALSCGPVVACELTGISLNTTGVKKTFTTGSAFSYDGLEVTASYSNCSDRKVTPTSVSTPDMSVAGEKTVTVSYTLDGVTKTASYDITVSDAKKYTIRFYDNGELLGEPQVVVEGEKAKAPSHSSSCSKYSFVGWWTASLAADNTTANKWVTDFTATKDQDYYAVYSHTDGTGTAGTDYQQISELSELTTGNYVVIGNNDCAMMNEIYSNYYLNTYDVTVSAGTISNPAANIVWEITRTDNAVSFYNEAVEQYVELYESGNFHDLGLSNNANWFTPTVSSGNWKFESKDCSGWYLVHYIYTKNNVSKHEFAAKQSSNQPIHLYKQAEASTMYFTSVVDCSSTAIENVQRDNVQCTKVMENGVLYIMYKGTKYNVQGNVVK